MDIIHPLLDTLGHALGPFAARLLAALAILLVAWLVSRMARSLVARLGVRARLDERTHNPGMSALLGNVAGWAVWLLALPALLGTLQLQGLLDPVNAMMARLMGFVPNLLGAAVILTVGVLAAGMVRQIATGLLLAAGSEKLADKIGMAPSLGKNSLAGIIGSILFALILLPTLAASLEALGLQSVSRPVGQLLDRVFELIPRLISAAIILGVAALIGRALANVVSGLLAGVGFNEWPARMGLKRTRAAGGRDAATLAGALVMGAVMWVALTQAIEVLGLPLLTDAVATLGAVLAHVAVAALLLGAGLWLATLAAQWVAGSAWRNAAVLAQVVRVAILFFAAALALRQAGLPAEIVTIAFASVVGALAVGAAIALGVGGRHVAARLLDRAARSFEEPGAGDGQQQPRA